MCSEMKWGWGGRDGDGVFFDYWEREVGEEVDMREGRRGEELQGAVIPILHRFSLSVFTFFLLVYLLLFLFHSYTYTPRFIYRSLYKPPVNWCLMFWFFFTAFPSSAFRVVLILFPSSFASPSDIIHRVWGYQAFMGRCAMWIKEWDKYTCHDHSSILATKQNKATKDQSFSFSFFHGRLSVSMPTLRACSYFQIVYQCEPSFRSFGVSAGTSKWVKMVENGWILV